MAHVLARGMPGFAWPTAVPGGPPNSHSKPPAKPFPHTSNSSSGPGTTASNLPTQSPSIRTLTVGVSETTSSSEISTVVRPSVKSHSTLRASSAEPTISHLVPSDSSRTAVITPTKTSKPHQTPQPRIKCTTERSFITSPFEGPELHSSTSIPQYTGPRSFTESFELFQPPQTALTERPLLTTFLQAPPPSATLSPPHHVLPDPALPTSVSDQKATGVANRTVAIAVGSVCGSVFLIMFIILAVLKWRSRRDILHADAESVRGGPNDDGFAQQGVRGGAPDSNIRRNGSFRTLDGNDREAIANGLILTRQSSGPPQLPPPRSTPFHMQFANVFDSIGRHDTPPPPRIPTPQPIPLQRQFGVVKQVPRSIRRSVSPLSSMDEARASATYEELARVSPPGSPVPSPGESGKTWWERKLDSLRRGHRVSTG
ncbi:hypothetical protein BDV96DRAFT_652400 [Lophiotrema nucula]|uniref:Uncharacterized protein n=1 Tax=Lophiotrema nucula TaxID=690887 RepID=A0A6A5YQU3_9PLEO|nr:hypothetical protein BDV96DRAFT_652400 [Lophiotrema nucula]